MDRTAIACTTIASLSAVAVAALLALGPLNPPSGAITSTNKTLSEVEPRIAISPTNTPGTSTSQFRISQSGSYYLTGNITGVSGKCGILIDASNVTIDLRGFTLQGVPGSLDGIRTNGLALHKITIRHGNITEWGQDGIDLIEGGLIGASHLVQEVHAFQNSGDGISTGYSSIVRDCTATANGARGIFVQDGSRVETCSVRQSFGNGIEAQRGSTLTACTSEDNGSVGIVTHLGSVVSECSANGNAVRGFELQSSTAIACQANNNASTGIFASMGGVLTKCFAFSNGQRGIEVNSGVCVSECACHFNQDMGILAFSGSPGIGNSIINNNCTSNGLTTPTGTSSGIFVNGRGNRVEGNNCALNDRGINVIAPGNIIVRNTCSNNNTNWVITTNNVVGPILNRTSPSSPAMSGDTASDSTGSTHPNANFSY